MKRHLHWLDVGAAAFLFFLVSMLIWKRPEPRGILLWIAGIIVADFVVNIRWRLGLACPHCGFDPLLYKKNAKAAAERVRQFYQTRKERPDFFMRSQALLETQKRIREGKKSHRSNYALLRAELEKSLEARQ